MGETHRLLIGRRANDFDRTFWTLLHRRWTGWRRALVIVQPETVVRWRRQGFKYFWRWKSRVLSLDSKLALVFV